MVSWSRSYPGRLHPGTVRDDVSTVHVSAARPEVILDLLDPRTWARAARRIREFGADLTIIQWVHPIHAPVILVLERMLRRAGIPVVMICHNVEPHESSLALRLVTRLTLRRASALVVHSPSLREAAERIAPGVAVVEAFMPTFLNVANAAPPPPAEVLRAFRQRLGADDRPLLLCFGYVRPYKGVEDAIAAMGHLRRDALLLVAGECWGDADRYRRLAKRDGLQGRVALDLRYIPNDEIGLLFGACDAVVLPYRSATQSGVASLAFAYGKPVVATRTGGLSALVVDGETGRLATPGDPVHLAASIDALLSDSRDWRPAIAQACRRNSWEAYAFRVQDHIRNTRPARDAATHAILDAPSRRSKAGKITAILTQVGPVRGMRVLDVGTGSGTIAAEIARAVGQDGSVQSIDVTDVRVERDGYRFRRYDGAVLPFGHGAFDIVVSNHVIEHVGGLQAQRAHLAELARVLAPGGLIYVAVPNRYRLVENHYRLPFLSWLPGWAADRYLRAMKGQRHYDCRLLSRGDLLAMVRAAGMTPTDATRALVDVTAGTGIGPVGRVLARGPRFLRALAAGPFAPTIVVLGRLP